MRDRHLVRREESWERKGEAVKKKKSKSQERGQAKGHKNYAPLEGRHPYAKGVEVVGGKGGPQGGEGGRGAHTFFAKKKDFHSKGNNSKECQKTK